MADCSDCTALLDDNLTCLSQGRDLVARLTDEAFTMPGPTRPAAGVGSHLRHCLDHYDSFLHGEAEGLIDYDRRERNPELERDRTVALAKLDAVSASLAALKENPADQAVRVKMDCGDETDEASWWAGSTRRRELQFLISHTVHHYALMAQALNRQGVEVEAGFGVAPSTLRHLRSHEACAR